MFCVLLGDIPPVLAPPAASPVPRVPWLTKLAPSVALHVRAVTFKETQRAQAAVDVKLGLSRGSLLIGIYLL